MIKLTNCKSIVDKKEKKGNRIAWILMSLKQLGTGITSVPNYKIYLKWLFWQHIFTYQWNISISRVSWRYIDKDKWTRIKDLLSCVSVDILETLLKWKIIWMSTLISSLQMRMNGKTLYISRLFEHWVYVLFLKTVWESIDL